MKLWQAILIGCDRRAQAFGDWFQKQPDDTVHSCALGAAHEALTGKLTFGDKLLDAYYPQFFHRRFQSLECLEKCADWLAADATYADMIAHLNDWHKWPREKIALVFVKPIEEAMEEQSHD